MQSRSVVLGFAVVAPAMYLPLPSNSSNRDNPIYVLITDTISHITIYQLRSLHTVNTSIEHPLSFLWAHFTPTARRKHSTIAQAALMLVCAV